MLVEDPLPSSASHAVIENGERGMATAGREFDLFAHPDNGCESVTQFVGYIPPGRAPDHFHLYDEVGYILAGEGAFHVGDESAPLRPGSCFHLPARLVHSLENHGPGEMRVLGVFRPAGSPAEAYYPDGSAAVVPVVTVMPHIERTAHVRWDGNVARGAGSLDAASPARSRSCPFSLPSRIGDPDGKTSPEELLAAAHGGCITMSLAGVLTAAGTPPGRLDTDRHDRHGRGRGPGTSDHRLE